eukprot:m.268412 g.268412  ORF g.268412 m.268412 type:complete len:513 (+) comp78397_c0_seq1:99-1637(+)
MKQYVVTHPFTRSRTDELTLRINDQITVLEQSTDGWMRGQHASGTVGWFPANHVILLTPNNQPRTQQGRPNNGGVARPGFPNPVKPRQTPHTTIPANREPPTVNLLKPQPLRTPNAPHQRQPEPPLRPHRHPQQQQQPKQPPQSNQLPQQQHTQQKKPPAPSISNIPKSINSDDPKSPTRAGLPEKSFVPTPSPLPSPSPSLSQTSSPDKSLALTLSSVGFSLPGMNSAEFQGNGILLETAVMLHRTSEKDKAKLRHMFLFESALVISKLKGKKYNVKSSLKLTDHVHVASCAWVPQLGDECASKQGSAFAFRDPDGKLLHMFCQSSTDSSQSGARVLAAVKERYAAIDKTLTNAGLGNVAESATGFILKMAHDNEGPNNNNSTTNDLIGFGQDDNESKGEVDIVPVADRIVVANSQESFYDNLQQLDDEMSDEHAQEGDHTDAPLPPTSDASNNDIASLQLQIKLLNQKLLASTQELAAAKTTIRAQAIEIRSLKGQVKTASFRAPDDSRV